MNAERRDQIAAMFGAALADLQYRGQGYRDGRVFNTYGVVYVPDRTSRGKGHEKEATPRLPPAHQDTDRIRGRASNDKYAPHADKSQGSFRSSGGGPTDEVIKYLTTQVAATVVR